MRRPARRTYHQLADINITNLVDVVLVLLIIFMISAPLLQSGIEVDLPKTTAAPIEQEVEGVVVTIDKKGGIYINDVWSRLDDFETKLDKEMKLKHTKSVFLRSDSTVAYGIAIDVIGRMKAIGIEQIGLVTAQAERARRNAQRK